ncbi:MAG TPA: hypothetical protein VHC96_17445 [Puia sp.]|nr:hypothetical protein [Puia sp.]
MEKIVTTLIAGLILWLSALPAMAQQDVPPTPSWVSDRGYWVVESRNDSSIVYFYNNDNQLVHKEQLAGVLNVGRRKTKLRLTRTLEQVVPAFSRQNRPIHRQMMSGDASSAGQP